MTGTTCTGLTLLQYTDRHDLHRINTGSRLASSGQLLYTCIMIGKTCTGLGLSMGVINEGAKHVRMTGKRSATAAQVSLFTTQLDWQKSLLTAAHGYACGAGTSYMREVDGIKTGDPQTAYVGRCSDFVCCRGEHIDQHN